MADFIEPLVAVLTDAFGPDGRAVLVQNPTGQMCITRSGFNVLQSVYSERVASSPRLKIVMDSVEVLRETMGDGVKSFIFIVAGMLRGCVRLEGPFRVATQLKVLQSRLSQLSFDKLNTDLNGQNAIVNVELGNCFYYKVIDTFLSTRFPRPVSSVLGAVLCKWITMISGRSPEHITWLYRDFSVLCRHQHGGCKPVTECSIQQGFVLSRRPINLTQSGRRKVIVLAFHDADAECGAFDELDVRCEVDRLLRELARSEHEAADEEHDGALLITAAILSDLTLFKLRRANVAVAHGVPIDEVKYVFTVLSHRSVGEDNVVSRGIINVTLERIRGYVVLNFPDIYQLFLCGPTKELCVEYAQSCQHALKLIMITNQSTFRNLVVRSGGHFESSLYKHLSSKRDVRTNTVPRFANRAELLASLKKSDAGNGDSCEINQCIGEAFVGIHADVLDAVFQGMLAVPNTLPPCEAVEPVALRVGILLHALGTVITLIKIDAVLFTKRPSVSS